MEAKLLGDLKKILEQSRGPEAPALAALRRVLTHFECVTGTVHRLEPGGRVLSLVAQVGIPDSILDRVQSIPVGKGMAGLAAERRAPVQVCNLQTDASGVAKPAAKETQMQGSIAVPMERAGALLGTLGIAKPVAHEFTSAETTLLLEAAALIGARL